MAYTDIAGVRAVSAGDDVSDGAQFNDAAVTEAISYAEETIDHETGTSFEYKAFSSTSDGDGRMVAWLIDGDTSEPILFPRTIAAVTISGVALVATDWAGWSLSPAGRVASDTNVFASSTVGRNIVITGTAGRTAAAPAPIKLAAEMIARDYLLSRHDRTGERALQSTDEFGTTVLAQPGKHGPTGLPRVNKILFDWSSRLPGID